MDNEFNHWYRLICTFIDINRRKPLQCGKKVLSLRLKPLQKHRETAEPIFAKVQNAKLRFVKLIGCNGVITKKERRLIMAMPIKAVPILSGEIADEFVRRAEENERKPRRKHNPERQAMVAEMMRQLREFKPSWRK